MYPYKRRKRKRRFEWTSTLEEEKSKDSLTIHSGSFRKLCFLCVCSDDTGKAIEDADHEERDTDHEMRQINVKKG